MQSPQANNVLVTNNAQRSDEQQPHLLSLKVMRLSRPQLTSSTPIYYESNDKDALLTEGLDALNTTNLAASHPIDTIDTTIQIRDFGLSQLLQLPAAFGNIYLGENFNTFISINNESPYSVQQVSVKIELQTSSQRFLLADNTNTPQDALHPNATHGTTVSHEIKELGVHILVCSVQYLTPDNQKRHFRKFYKFQVSNPLAVKTKLNSMADGRVFLEAQLQNVSAGPMYLERMKFEPSEHFDHEDFNQRINTKDVDVAAPSVFGSEYIQPQDVRQYLYMLTPKSSHQNNKISRTTNALGKLDIIWRSHMGEMGRLQTSQLTRKAPILEDLEVQPFWPILGEPVKVTVEKPFKLGLRIKNHSNDNMKLMLSAVKVKMGSVLLSGPSTQQLGEVSANQTVETQVEFFPLSPGLQRVGGLKVVDLLSGYSKDVDHLCDISVLQHDNSSGNNANKEIPHTASNSTKL